MSERRRRLDEALEAQAAGRLQAAWGIVSSLLGTGPDDRAALMVAAELRLAARDPAGAVDLLDRVLALDPRDVDALADKAHALALSSRLTDAVVVARTACALRPADPRVLAVLGHVLTTTNQHADALACFEAAAAAAPGEATHQYNLATSLRFAGSFRRAEEALNVAIRLRPDDAEGLYARSGLRRQTAEHNNLEHLHAFDRPGRDWRSRVHVYYALAKEYEDLGRWDEAFEWLSRGADLRRANMRYDVAADVAKLDTLREVFDAASFAGPRRGATSDAPIFVLGLPRAGSTLVDRILSSHSRVDSAGELSTFGQVVVDLARPLATPGDASFRGFAEATLRIDPEALGEGYLAASRYAAGDRPRFVDKLPFNFLYIGLIRRALPNARIVHVRRAPMDACFSMYKMLFRGAYPFSYDLADLAAYYPAYRRLMDHWRAIAPGAVYDLSYERLVDDPDRESRALLAACGLGWEDACRDFHLNRSPSTTASAVQVRQPLHADAVAQWRRHARRLAPLHDALVAAGIDPAAP